MINEIPSVSIQPKQMTFRSCNHKRHQEIVDQTELNTRLKNAAKRNIYEWRMNILNEVVNMSFTEKVKTLLRGFIK